MGNRNNRLGQEEAHHQDDPCGDAWQRPEAFLAARSQPLQAVHHQIAEVQNNDFLFLLILYFVIWNSNSHLFIFM